MVTFLSDSTDGFVATETVGGFNYGSQKNGFDDIFQEAYDSLMSNQLDIMVDINDMIRNKAKVAAFKESLLGELKQECANDAAEMKETGTHAGLYDQISMLFDNCTNDLVTESTRVGNLLPIKAVDYPILIKQQLKLATKDIMQTEVTNTPIVKKHIEQTYVIDPKTRKRWKYPQVFFTDDFEEIFNAGKGYPIDEKKVKLPLYNYDIISNLTDGDVNRDDFTLNLQIEKVYVGDTEVVLDPPMRINPSDMSWLGGKIDQTVKDSTGADVEVKDLVMGFADFTEKTVTLNAAAGQVTAVSFKGYLSNEKNERTVQFGYEREEREWKIEDGMRADMPYSLEQLEDTKALLNIDLYKKTYNDMADFLAQMEDSKILKWLDDQYDKYNGITINPLEWKSFVTERVFDVDSTSLTTALPVEFIEKQFKFCIDRIINDVADDVKLDDLTFVIYGNPRFISLLDPVVNWVTRPGQSSNGVKLDYGYGIMTSGNVKVQVVSTKKVMAKYDAGAKLFDGLRIIPFPLSKEQMTFKHFKYTTHILTSQNSAFRPNVDTYSKSGSYTYLIGTSRYTNAAVQGIQTKVKIANCEQYISVY